MSSYLTIKRLRARIAELEEQLATHETSWHEAEVLEQTSDAVVVEEDSNDGDDGDDHGE